jgi:hypothetical protein
VLKLDMRDIWRRRRIFCLWTSSAPGMGRKNPTMNPGLVRQTKNVPTWLHILLQQILGEFLTAARHRAEPELELRIDPSW